MQGRSESQFQIQTRSAGVVLILTTLTLLGLTGNIFGTRLINELNSLARKAE